MLRTGQERKEPGSGQDCPADAFDPPDAGAQPSAARAETAEDVEAPPSAFAAVEIRSLPGAPASLPHAAQPPEKICDLLSLGLDPEDAPADHGSDPDSPPFSWCPSQVPEEAGARIGNYRLLRPLGEGAFGRVWLALQLRPLQREVALKLLKVGMSSREAIARFAGEQQALAMMHHPNIAGVLDAGTSENGRLYFVMERVDGIPITEYCDRHRLDSRSRIELFLDVCEAIQHAHQKAIIHRDIKPSNVLVSEGNSRPVPKVIDFGIAKILHSDPEGLTHLHSAEKQTGLYVGTPGYISPEQALDGNDVDTRSDLFSLGAILHELLVGCPPTGDGDHGPVEARGSTGPPCKNSGILPSEMLPAFPKDLERIAKERRSTARRLRRILREDLDWILLRTLQTDRAQRYASVGEFADDLKRHLSGETVRARPPTRPYLLKKLAKRNHHLISAAAAGLLLLFSGLFLSISQALRATHAERLAKGRLILAEQARDAAEELLEESVLGARDRAIPSGNIGLLAETIGGAQRYLESLPEELVNEKTEIQRIHLYFNQGFVTLAEGDLLEARRHLVRALDLIEQIEGALADERPLPEALQREAVFIALMAAHAFIDDDPESASLFRSTARARCERWLRANPDSAWAYGHLAHEAGLAAMERVLVVREPQRAAPHLLRLRHYSTRLRALAPESSEYFQARGLSLMAEAFAASHLGGSPRRAIQMLENSASNFGRGYATSEAALYRSIFLDMQLRAETAAGTRLIALAISEEDSALMSRGKATILSVHQKRRELAREDNTWMEWWRGLANSSRALVEVAKHVDDPEEALRLVRDATDECRRVARHNRGHVATSQATVRALLTALEWHESLDTPWNQERIEILSLAFSEWARTVSNRPNYYNSHKDLRILLAHFEAVFRDAPPEHASLLLRTWTEISRNLSGMRVQNRGNPALESALQAHLALSPRLRASRRSEASSALLFPGFFRNGLRVASEILAGPPDDWMHSFTLLVTLGSELASWHEKAPPEVRDYALDGMQGQLTLLFAKLPPAEGAAVPAAGINAWAAHRIQHCVNLSQSAQTAEESLQSMIDIYWQIHSHGSPRESGIRLQNTLLDAHLASLEEAGLRHKAAGRMAEARRYFCEIASVRSARTHGLTAFHFCHWGHALQLVALTHLAEGKPETAIRFWVESRDKAEKALSLNPGYRPARAQRFASDAALFSLRTQRLPSASRPPTPADLVSTLESIVEEPLRSTEARLIEETIAACEEPLRNRMSPEKWQRTLVAWSRLKAGPRL